ncbi:hypothetical protein KEM52_005510 [Ascosphaera acerosa]|nr:hypothetical protein KEM52_005510 [Ascosphaera acerosa]
MTRYSRFHAHEDLSSPIYESPGLATSDSLAAESYRTGGAYSLNRAAQPVDVVSDNATLATTDTSAASTRLAAPFAEARPTTRNGIYTEYVDDADALADADVSTATTTTDSAFQNASYATDAAGFGYGYPTSAATTTQTYSATDAPSGTTTYRTLTRGPGVFEDQTISETPTAANASYYSNVGTLSDPSRAATAEYQARSATGFVESSTPISSTRTTRAEEDCSYLDDEEA